MTATQACPGERITGRWVFRVVKHLAWHKLPPLGPRLRADLHAVTRASLPAYRVEMLQAVAQTVAPQVLFPYFIEVFHRFVVGVKG